MCIHTTDWTPTVIQSLQHNNDNTIFDEACLYNDNNDDDDRKGTIRMPWAKVRRNIANKTYDPIWRSYPLGVTQADDVDERVFTIRIDRVPTQLTTYIW